MVGAFLPGHDVVQLPVKLRQDFPDGRLALEDLLQLLVLVGEPVVPVVVGLRLNLDLKNK